MSNDRQSSMTNFERPLIPRARIQGPGCTAHRAEARRHAGLRAVGPARAHLHSFDSGCVLARAMLSIVRACLHAMCCPRVTRAPHPRRCITWMVDLAQAYSSGRRRTPGGRPRRRIQAAQRASRERTYASVSASRCVGGTSWNALPVAGKPLLLPPPHTLDARLRLGPPPSPLAPLGRSLVHTRCHKANVDACHQLQVKSEGAFPKRTSHIARWARRHSPAAVRARRSPQLLVGAVSLSLSLSLVRGRHMRA